MATNQLFATVRAKAPLPYAQRKSLLSLWRPRVAKVIARSLYPEFRGTYEQHLWLLTLKAAEGEGYNDYAAYTTYAQEAKEKGVLFLQPVKRIEDTRLCAPSDYLYYILNWKQPQVNALLAGASRYSERLNKKYLEKALRAHAAYDALCDKRTPGLKGKKERKRALDLSVKLQMMLTVKNNCRFKVIAYGWTHLEQYA